MSLVDEQWAFLQDVARLIAYAAGKGYVLTGAELFRTQEQAWMNSCPAGCTLTAKMPDGREFHYWDAVGGKGISKSLHMQRLAIDLNLIKDGKLAGSVDDYADLGEFWEGLNPLNRWGGKFVHPRPDADHFERQLPATP